MASLAMMSTGGVAASPSLGGRRGGPGGYGAVVVSSNVRSGFFHSDSDKLQMGKQSLRQRQRGDGGLVVYAAKGRNARLAGRDKKAQRREDDKMLDNREAAEAERVAKRKQAKKKQVKKEPGVKYSKRGKVSSQPGQVSKAALKRIREVRKKRGRGGDAPPRRCRKYSRITDARIEKGTKGHGRHAHRIEFQWGRGQYP